MPCLCIQTTLARIIAGVARDKCACRFVQLSATTSGINEIKDVVKVAKNEMKFRRKTILFIDEIHRFNKLQQVCQLVMQCAYLDFCIEPVKNKSRSGDLESTL